jgi:hypothetical protein
MTVDIKALLKQAKRRTAKLEVCLRGDLAGDYEQLERDLAKLPPSNRLGGDPERQRITAQMELLRAEMQEGTVQFRLEALSDTAFQRLVDEHPPRRDGDEVHERDAQSGYNRATFYDALIRACTVEPELDAEDWELLLGEDGMSGGQKLALSLEASRINGESVDVPFSPAASNGNPG